jgi:hypothetical protein
MCELALIPIFQRTNVNHGAPDGRGQKAKWTSIDTLKMGTYYTAILDRTSDLPHQKQ